MNFRKTGAALAATATLLSLAACGSDTGSGSGSDSASNADGGTAGGGNYVIGNGTEPQNPLVPANTNERGGGKIIESLFAGLAYYDADGELHNEIAESIEPNEDNTVFTVKLRDTKFSDGSPVTSSSFVDAWNYAVANDMNTAFFFEPIKGYEPGAESMEGLEVIDDHTFTITLSQPQADFPMRLGYSTFSPLPDYAYDDIDAYGGEPVSNGPYKLADWVHNQEITLVPNPEYDGPREVHNDGLKIVFYANDDAAYADLLAGNLDVLDTIPDSALAVFQDDLGDRAVTKAAAGFDGFAIPYSLEHFSGEEGTLRRHAISHAVDRKAISDSIFQGMREPAVDFTSSVLPGYSADIENNDVFEYDPEKAKELWAQADEISPWDGEFIIGYNTDGGHQAWVEAATNQLRNNLGIKAEGNPYPDFKSFRDEITNETIGTAFRAGWKADYPSLDNFLSPLYASGASANDTGYHNPEFDALLKKAASASSQEESFKLYNQAQSVMMKDMPAIPMWYNSLAGGYSEAVDNVVFSWNGTPLYYAVSKK
ncbi:ABC transporter substrate-binding protein [Corynebacterium phocae]|uniref:ABC transporter substrate-binding protein n=1 Tax=Corynebacterium phocae TaxID=161895 RepID=A0A1L7D104_9CORY|nr:ABC transporter substrate-binding protein [Corynebacterium phocae]APT91743.1 ABC transporter substrate-binding protein [Corynebacterium phocae]KAA8728508.1 ABC transporter substrate-binding protein [Corynebacterium phocae]